MVADRAVIVAFGGGGFEEHAAGSRDDGEMGGGMAGLGKNRVDQGPDWRDWEGERRTEDQL